MMTAVYPTVRDNPELNRLVEEYPEALKAFIAFGGSIDYVSGAGYLGSELFSFMVPLLFLIAAVANGASAIAGEEERGTLDLLLSQPVTRRGVARGEARRDGCSRSRLSTSCSGSRSGSARRSSPWASPAWHLLAASTDGRARSDSRSARSRSSSARRRAGRRSRSASRPRPARRRVPRQLARGARERARPVPEGVAVLPLRRRRSAAPGARARAHRLPRRGRDRRGSGRDRALRAARRPLGLASAGQARTLT